MRDVKHETKPWWCWLRGPRFGDCGALYRRDGIVLMIRPHDYEVFDHSNGLICPIDQLIMYESIRKRFYRAYRSTPGVPRILSPFVPSDQRVSQILRRVDERWHLDDLEKLAATSDLA
jgi:hypothetical protein